MPPLMPDAHCARTPPSHPAAPAPQLRRRQPAEAPLAVVNVYQQPQSLAGRAREIKALRVLQVLPMTVPSGGPPHEIGCRVPTAGDSVVLCR